MIVLRYTRTFCCQASHSQWSGGASQVHLQHTKGQRTPGSRPGRSGGGTSGTQRTAATELRCLPYLMSQPPSSLHKAVVIAPKTYFKRQIYTNILPLICKFTSGCFQRRLRRGPWGTGGGPAGAGQGASHRTAGTARAAQPRAAVGELHLLYTDAVPSGRVSRPAPPSARRGGARSRAGRAAEAGRQRGAARAMGQGSPWLNQSAIPRAAGGACAADGQRAGPFSGTAAALLTALIGLLVLATVLGNALVILAFVVDRRLRTQGDYFFLNLAVADLLVGECQGRWRDGGAQGTARVTTGCVRRQLLHPALHPLRADGRVEARPGIVQAVAGGGLPGVHRLCLQHRPYQLQQVHLRHQGGKGCAPGYKQQKRGLAEMLITEQLQEGLAWVILVLLRHHRRREQSQHTHCSGSRLRNNWLWQKWVSSHFYAALETGTGCTCCCWS